MGQTKPPLVPKERRTSNCHEVVLGFGKKQNLEESHRCPQCVTPSCLSGCPLGIDIPGFIRLLREDNTVGALERIRQQNPFPAICGRICTAPCEPACIFNEDGTPISIRSLERYASDFGRGRSNKAKNNIELKGKKIAILGSGPSGMSAAYCLARQGFKVTIFEACAEPGGLLRYGIPEFRLPQKVLDEQFTELESMGVKIILNALVGSTLSVRDIFAQGHAAILLTVGAGVPDFADISGHYLSGVYYAEEFLMRMQLISKSMPQEHSKFFLGQKTTVIGSGPAALDAARLSLRQGQQVDLVFGGLEEQLEVNADDLAQAVEEGLQVHAPVEPLSIASDGQGFACAVNCQKLEVVEDNGKLFLQPTAGEQLSIETQTVVLSHGRRPNHFLKGHLPQLKFNEDGTLWVDAGTGQTSVENIFAAGEVVTNAGVVVNAIKSGKDAALKIMEFLKI